MGSYAEEVLFENNSSDDTEVDSSADTKLLRGYEIFSPNKIMAYKSGHAVRLRCPKMSTPDRSVSCTLSCPRCYEQNTYQSVFGPGIEHRSLITGTQLVTCGQILTNEKENADE